MLEIFLININCFYLLLLCAQKKKQEKGTRLSRPAFSEIPCASRCCRDAEKLVRLKRGLRQFQRLFPTTTAMLSVKEWGPNDKTGTSFYCHFT